MALYGFVYGRRTVSACLLLYTDGRAVVERGNAGSDSSAVPTIADLLTAYRDRTGDSYEDMARKVGDEISRSRMHQLTTRPPREFPKLPRTVERLADMLEVPVTTIVLAFAAGLGIPVTQTGTMLEVTLPAGTDTLTAEDREAIRHVTRALVDARRGFVQTATGSGKSHTVGELVDLARPPAPDLSRVAARRGQSEGRRRRAAQDEHAETQDPSQEPHQ